MKWYGSVVNRIEEGRKVPEIKEGMDLTMYYWSDRTCYYVVEVEDQKRIKVQEYNVVADHSKDLGMGHQEWLYFKTRKEQADYMKQFYPDSNYDTTDPEPETWVYRYNKWKREVTFTEENHCTEKELKSLKEKGYYKRYYDLSGKISFGRRDYYYDWSF